MRYTMFSAGQGSFRTAKIDRLLHPDEPSGLVFTDVLYEDADAYRFLIEAAASVYDRPPPNWLPHAEDFPDYRVDESVPIEEYAGNPAWRAFLQEIRERTAETIPELIWLVEGRDPWEVFRDERYLGNTRADPCSKYGKREMLDKWRALACDPAVDVFLVGIGDHEKHRFHGGKGRPGIRARMAALGWNYEAPLIAVDDAAHDAPSGTLHLAYSPLDQLGLRPPRLYAKGYMHNNCGGFCVKAGLAHWQNRWRVDPERYAYDAMMERKIRNYLTTGKATILRDRRGGKTKPLSLDAFAERCAGPTIEYQPGESGCGCMVDG